MLQGNYGKESFDLRLTILRLLRQWHIIVGVTVLGVVLFGGGYYAKNVLFRGDAQYGATSVYRVEFNGETEAEIAVIYINDYTWNTYMQTDLFLDAVMRHLEGKDVLSDGSKLGMSKAEVATTIRAFLPSDLRVPSTVVTTCHPEKSELIARAVEVAMCNELAEAIREVASIKVIHPGVAEEVIPDVRTERALILSGILSFFFIVLFLLIKETWDDSIYLPSSIRKRYGIPCVGGIGCCGARFAEEVKGNTCYLYRGISRVAVCPVAEDIVPDVILGELRKLCSGVVGENWFATPSPLLCPEICEVLRQADGILLVVNSGAHVGKNFERTLEFLEQQDCKVSGVILSGADELLLKWYYMGVNLFGRNAE